MRDTPSRCLIGASLLLCLIPAASAHQTHRSSHIKMVGYDAKDKKYYSVAWAKAHGMHDKGGDPLTIVPLSSLPKGAKLSHAMHGKL